MSVYQCMQDLVGVSVEACDPDNSTRPRYYLNSLTGITVKTASKAANEEQITGLNLLNQKITMAIDELVADVLMSIGVTVTGKALVKNSQSGFINQGAAALGSEVGARGIIFRLTSQDYVDLQINGINYTSSAAVSGMKFKIVDLAQGVLVKEITVDVVKGVNFIPVNITIPKYGSELHLGVVYDSANSVTFQTKFSNIDCCPLAEYFCANGLYAESARWASYANTTYSNRIASLGSHGMTISYSVMCSAESFICRNAQMFGYALLYKAGTLVMQEILHSNRLNGITIMSKEGAAQLMEQYNDKYNALLTAAMSGVSTNHSLCFSCRTPISIRTTLP